MTSNLLRASWPPLLGGLIALAAALLLRTLIGTRLLAEVALEGAVSVLPGQDFSTLLGIFGSYGKALFFCSVLAAMLAFYVAAWLQLRRFAGHGSDAALRTAGGAALLTTAAFVLATVAVIAATEASLGPGTGWFGYVFATAMTSGLYAAVAGIYSLGDTSQDAGAEEYFRHESRRQFLSIVPGLALGGLALLVIGHALRDTAGGGVQRSRRGERTPSVTPNGEFYVISKNLIDPRVEGEGWSLSVGGETERTLSLRLGDLQALPSRVQYTTLQCISNEVGGELISNALWRGVPLRDVLDQAGVLPGARNVRFRSADGYTESLPLDFAMQEQVLLAYEMNGEPLPHRHGFPLRLVTPGKYGIKNPKWITDIELIDDEYLGYWQRQGWSQEARMRTTSRIDVPGRSEAIAPGTRRIEGLAFSGDRGIGRVEVSGDGGSTWADAALSPALGPYTWVQWRYDWRTPSSGQPLLLVRATDGAGEEQTWVEEAPFPNGASGYHRIGVRIVDG